MPSKACSVAIAGVGAYAAAQAFLAPSVSPQVNQQQVRNLRQQPAATESSSAAAGALTLGVAGVAVASAAQVGKRTARRSQVVRQATAVAEKVFTKMPASVKPGVVTGQALVDLLNYAKENEFAIPGVNVVSSSSVNACMEAAKKAGGPVMVTFSRGGGQFLAGKAADNTDDAACIAGTVAGALHVRQVAKLYGVPVILHTDHCQKSWLPWFDGLIEASEEYFEKNGEPLFSSHMLDLSEESLEDNISICKKYLERMAKINLLLEMELGVTGGEEDGVDNTDVDSSRLYTQPEEVWQVYEELSSVPNGNFTVAAAFGNVHGVYAPGNVSLKPVILHNTQKYIKEKLGCESDKPVSFVFHGGSGSSLEDIRYAIEAGVVKMNIDTDTQWAFWDGMNPRIPVQKLFERLCSVNSLKSLTLPFISNAYCYDIIPPFFQSLVQLTDLWIFNDVSSLHDGLIASIKCLTNLTKLHLHTSPPRHHLEPFVELRKIRDLDVNAFSFFDRNGSSMFPSLTNLTRLSFEGSRIGEEPRLNCTEAIKSYASSLEHLVLNFGYQKELHVSYTSMTSLTNLQTLIVFNSISHSQDLAEVLPQLRSLVNLGMKFHGRLHPAIRQSIARCTGLKSLDCTRTAIRGRDENSMSLVPYLTQLTDLVGDYYGKFLGELRCLTLLQRLQLRVLSEGDYSLNEAMNQMPRLRTIEVEFVPYNLTPNSRRIVATLRLSGSALSAMRHLESVCLRDVDVDESFFHALASNAELTKLEFISYRRRGYAQNFMQQVNLLRNLEELTLDVQENYNVCDLLLPEDLSKLKRLDIGRYKSDVDAMQRKFNQSIRRVLVDDEKESAWRSRRSVY